MISVSAKALWWDPPEVCTCVGNPDEDWCPHDTEGGWPAPMLVGEINGWQYLTDRYVFMPVARLGELPVGYGTVLNLMPLPAQAADGMAEWLSLTPSAEPSDAQFVVGTADVLESAGFLIRELPVKTRVHAICDPDLSVVGLVMPVRELRPADAGCDGRPVAQRRQAAR